MEYTPIDLLNIATLASLYITLLSLQLFEIVIPFVYAAVMRSSGFQYLKENSPSLQSELLMTVAGCEEDCSSGGKSRSVWAQLSDGGDANGRRVRPRLT